MYEGNDNFCKPILLWHFNGVVGSIPLQIITTYNTMCLYPYMSLQCKIFQALKKNQF